MSEIPTTVPQGPGDKNTTTVPRGPGDKNTTTVPRGPGDKNTTTVPRGPGDKKVLKCGVAIVGGGETILSLKPLVLNQFLHKR